MAMIRTDVIIVGGGPAGAACAWRLKQKGADCLVLDRQEFPRAKLCAGWITPEVLRDLNVQASDYPYGLTAFKSSRVSFRGIAFTSPGGQYAIRRVEFDDWLLQRAGTPVQRHHVQTIARVPDGYAVDGEYFCQYLVGAGGTYCPVQRSMFSSAQSRPKSSLIIAQEEEFRYAYSDGRCWLWFFEDRLPGYAWYVPKVDGYVNVGVGGKAEVLKANGDTLKRHWNRLVQKLDRLGLVRGHDYEPSGHTYFLRHNPVELRRDNAFLIGDAAGLATLDMGEGIRPAIKSGLLAAEAILHGADYSVASIPKYSLPPLMRLPFPR